MSSGGDEAAGRGIRVVEVAGLPRQHGTAAEHGTMFVGLTNDQSVMQRMLERMAGIEGPRDELTRYTKPVTGSYYVLPPLGALTADRTPDPDDD